MKCPSGVLLAVTLITLAMFLSASLVYELPHDPVRIQRTLAIVSAFAVGSMLFNEDEQKDDDRRGRSRLLLCVGSAAVVCFCYAMGRVDSSRNNAGLAAAVLLNFAYDCYSSTTPRRTYASGADNLMLVVVLSSRAHTETFSWKWAYAYVPPLLYGLLGYFVAHRRVHTRVRVPDWLKTFFVGGKQGIVAYTVVVELSGHVLDSVGDELTMYFALCVLAFSGPITSLIAGSQASKPAAIVRNDLANGCLSAVSRSQVVPEPDAPVIY